MNESQLLPFVSKSNAWGFINSRGEWLVPPRYQAASHFIDDLALVKSQQGIGFIDRQGREVIPCQFFDSLGFWEGYAAVAIASERTGVKWGLIDRRGIWAIQPAYDFLGPLFQGRSRCNVQGRWGYVDGKGEAVLSPVFDWAGDYIDGIARVQEVSHILRTYYIDLKASPIGPLSFENGEDFCNGVAGIYEGGKWGLLNSQGIVLISPRYAAIGEYSEGKLPVSSDGNAWLYVDSQGTRCIAASFEEASAFNEGWARARRGRKWGFIDGEGKWLMEPTFDLLEDFCQGWALFKQGDKVGYVNKAGRLLLDL